MVPPTDVQQAPPHMFVLCAAAIEYLVFYKNWDHSTLASPPVVPPTDAQQAPTNMYVLFDAGFQHHQIHICLLVLAGHPWVGPRVGTPGSNELLALKPFVVDHTDIFLLL